jgi:predicted MFS family arabinose efflux permease
MILGEAIVQILNGAFFLISNLYLSKEGYTHTDISDFIFYRFLGVLFLAMPFGMFIKTKRLLPFFYIGSIGMSICSLIVIFGIDAGDSTLAQLALLFWGICFMLIEVVKLPFIMRHCPKEQHSMAIALAFSTWSLGAVIAGIISFTSHAILPDFFQEKNVMYLISFLSLASLIFFFKVKVKDRVPKGTKSGFNLKDYDWWRVGKAVFPTFVIAVGAGLTVPFINLFFEEVHHKDFADFAYIGSIAYTAVFISVLFAPSIKDKWGYRKSIPATQIFSVLALIGLALTEFMADYSIGILFAIIFFVVRQPLMNLAQPLSSELVLNYVGKRNEEIVGAFQSTIWNGSFVFSSWIFGVLRSYQVEFMYIFLITAGLYLIAILLYIVLIRDYEKRIKLKPVSDEITI